MAGGAGFEILLAIVLASVTAGAGAAAVVAKNTRHTKHFAKLGELFKKLAKSLKGKNNRQTVPSGRKVVDNLGDVAKRVEYGDHIQKIKNKKSLKPNLEYIDDNGYKYTTDSEGRISSVEGELKVGDGVRNQYAQSNLEEVTDCQEMMEDT